MARTSILSAIEILLVFLGLNYGLVAVLMLALGPLLAPHGIRAHAERLGWSIPRTLLIGSLCWPVLVWRQLGGRR